MIAENGEPGDLSDDDFDKNSDDDSVGDSLVEGQYEDEEFEDDFDDEFEDEFVEDQLSPEEREILGPAKKRRRMFCANCNRMETHRRAHRKSWFDSYVTGMTFGLNRIFGPFKCTCCGFNRWIIKITRDGLK